MTDEPTELEWRACELPPLRCAPRVASTSVGYTSVAFRVPAPAPEAAEVAVTLDGPDDRSMVLLDRKVARGERIGTMDLLLPSDLTNGRYSIAVAVNGNRQGAWGLDISAAPQ